jgi:proteasome lid subunit RPN8/RPN11
VVRSWAVLSPAGRTARPAVRMSAELCRGLLGQARRIHAAGLKSYGLLTSDPDTAGYPFDVADVVFLDPARNRRNDAGNRAAFHAQGEYFRRFDDAGFVADPGELLAASRRIEDAGQQIVAVFHTHRRQPANFSTIDYRLHNPAFPWHLIICLRNPARPVLQPFRVDKPETDFGISETDQRTNSELSYPGPQVTPIPLLVSGPDTDLRWLLAAVDQPAA